MTDDVEPPPLASARPARSVGFWLLVGGGAFLAVCVVGGWLAYSASRAALNEIAAAPSEAMKRGAAK